MAASIWGPQAPSADVITAASTITFTPVGTIAATNVQDAIKELDAEAIARLEVFLGLAPSGAIITGTPSATTALFGDRTWKDVATSLGASILGFLQAGVSAVLRTIQSKLRDFVSVKDFGAVGDGVTDDAAAILAAFAASNHVHFPAGTYRCNSSITIGGGKTARGDNMSSTVVSFYGSEGFIAGGDMVKISDMVIRSYTAPGVADPLTNVGINCNGTAGTHRNFIRIEDVYLRGWARCVDFQYTWGSQLKGIVTVNCTKAVRLFGQSVNNAILGGNFTTIGGAGSITIDLVPDGGNVGEGLNILGALIGSAERAIVADSFLACSLSSCIVDDVSDTALTLENSAGFSMVGGYLASAGRCVQLNARGSLTEISTTVEAVDMRSTAGVAFNIDGNNRNVKLVGGSLRYGTSAVVSAATAECVSIVGVHGIQTGAGAQISLRGNGNDIVGVTGDMVPDSGTFASLRYAVTSVWNPASIANGVSVTSSAVTLTGAVVGDEVDVRAPTSEAGFLIDAFVDSTNNIKFVAFNVSGGPATPPNGIWAGRVRKT